MDTIKGPTLEELKRAAQSYGEAGYTCVPLRVGGKSPAYPKWQTPKTHPPPPFMAGMNCGLLMGVPVGQKLGFTCVVDLDDVGARHFAQFCLPATEMKTSRLKVRQMHWHYLTETPCPTRRFKHEGCMLVELLGKGSQVVVSPSIHPSGEPYNLVGLGNATKVSKDTLIEAVHRLAVHSLALKAASGQASVYRTVITAIAIKPLPTQSLQPANESKEVDIPSAINGMRRWVTRIGVSPD